MGQFALPNIDVLVRQIDSLTDEAVASTTRQIYARHPEMLQRFGEQGRASCSNDLLHHLEFLQGALQCGHAEPFNEYVDWLGSVLEGHGVARSHLLESLQLLQSFFSEKLDAVSISPITTVLQSGIATLSSELPLVPRYLSLLPTPREETKGYLQSLLSGDRASATRIVLDSLRCQIGLAEIDVRIIQPAMYEIGLLWQHRRISVAQEHLASAITQNVLARVFSEAEFSAPLERKAIFACVPGNHHVIGLRMISDLFEVSGWTVEFLGADVPAADLVQHILQRQPELVALSLSLPSQNKTTKAIVQQLRAELGEQCPAILVGGLASNQVDGLWKTVGADLWAANAIDSIREIK